MDKPDGQSIRTAPSPLRSASEGTQRRLLDAAAALIAEVGWGRVTTRAVAERAGLPHGAVSYHFRGKQDLLVKASLHAFEEVLPMAELEALRSVDDLISLVAAKVAVVDPHLSGLMMEAMREAERDATLRALMARMLDSYRKVLADLVRADQENGVIAREASPRGLAMVLAALADGLVLHVLVDPALDVADAVGALRALLGCTP